MAKVELVNKDAIQKQLELAGWVAAVSTDTDNKNYEKIAEHCIKANHTTPTRGMQFVFEISDVSRAFTHEFVRHELGLGKCQRSQRYVKEDGFEFVTPPMLQDVFVCVKIPHITLSDTGPEFIDDGFIETWLTFDLFQSVVEQMYTGFMQAGAKAEDARYALTNATVSKIRVVMNWEGLKNFCMRRLCSRAQWEIRQVAALVAGEVTKANEFLGKQLGAFCQIHGYCPELPKGCGLAPSKEELFSAYQQQKLLTCSLSPHSL